MSARDGSIPDPAAAAADDPYRHKWWGWGPEGARYDMESRPDLWAWILDLLGLDEAPEPLPVPALEDVALPPRRDTGDFEALLRERLSPDQIRGDHGERVRHAVGRSYRDLVRLRGGRVPHAPDVVVYPASHEEVVHTVEAAASAGVVLIPFGGGTNIVGCVEPGEGDRPVATVDMRRMCRLLSLDETSGLARLEAGMFGPQIEEALRARGFTLGHHPDSFVFSTLGGWIATRSAGTHSNDYGKIEDMVVGLRVVSPTGTLEVKPLPAASNGPDLKRLVTGSEGTLGIITEATMRVRPVPEVEDYRLVLFRSFEEGVAALHECVREDAVPSLARLSDEWETEFIFAARPPSRGLKRWIEKPVWAWLDRRGYERPAAMIVAVEGPRRSALRRRKEVARILKRHGAVDLGRSGGEAWKRSRYDVPYLRDYLLDFGLIGDSFETAASWGELVELHRRVVPAVREACREITGSPGYVGSHLSHVYDTGACLYLTAGALGRGGYEAMGEQYTAIKKVATECFLEAGAALSHHHAVGYEHGPWLEREISEPGTRVVDALTRALDPDDLLAPWNLGPAARRGRSGEP